MDVISQLLGQGARNPCVFVFSRGGGLRDERCTVSALTFYDYLLMSDGGVVVGGNLNAFGPMLTVLTRSLQRFVMF